MTNLLVLVAAAALTAETRWHDIRPLGIEGQGWSDTKAPYDRLPARAEGVVRPPVWSLSQDSAGLAVRFLSDADEIHARWTVRRKRLELPHMPATGVSGLDLYVRVNGKWRWLANGRPEKSPTNEVRLATGIGKVKREYMLYLPLYNGVESVELGVPDGAVLEKAAARAAGMKPVVFYGTSILQGGCAARPGMAYPSIVGRTLDWPTINLGFSGNGRSEPEMAKLLAELDPAAFVLDSLPNLQPKDVTERVEPFIQTLRAAHPKTPIVLVENVVYQGSAVIESRRKSYVEKNANLKTIFEKLRKSDKLLYYVPAQPLLGDDDEATVDGTHPTDVGFQRMAAAIAPVVRKAIQKSR